MTVQELLKEVQKAAAVDPNMKVLIYSGDDGEFNNPFSAVIKKINTKGFEDNNGKEFFCID